MKSCGFWILQDPVSFLSLVRISIHKHLIPHGEHLTRRFSQWVARREVHKGWCSEAGWSAFGVSAWTPTATTPWHECKCLLTLVGRHERRGMSLAVSNPSGIFYEQTLLLLALNISAWIKYFSMKVFDPFIGWGSGRRFCPVAHALLLRISGSETAWV